MRKDKRNRWESCLHMLLPKELIAKSSCPRAREENGKLHVSKEDCKDCPYWQGWESVSKRESKAYLSLCRNCLYCGINSSTILTCDYIGVTGHKRPCHPGDCKITGVRKERTRRRKCCTQ